MPVDVFRSIVSMEAFDDEWEAVDQGLQNWDEIAFAYALDRGNSFELRNLVNSIDVVDPLYAVPVALMDGVDTDIAKSWSNGYFHNRRTIQKLTDL